jgi:hypothetical protein
MKTTFRVPEVPDDKVLPEPAEDTGDGPEQDHKPQDPHNQEELQDVAPLLPQEPDNFQNPHGNHTWRTHWRMRITSTSPKINPTRPTMQHRRGKAPATRSTISTDTRTSMIHMVMKNLTSSIRDSVTFGVIEQDCKGPKRTTSSQGKTRLAIGKNYGIVFSPGRK